MTGNRKQSGNINDLNRPNPKPCDRDKIEVKTKLFCKKK